MKLAILSSTLSAPGAAALAKAGASVGIDVTILPIHDVDIATLDMYDDYIVRIGPRTYETYCSLLNSDIPSKLQAVLRPVLSAFSKVSIATVLSAKGIAIPDTKIMTKNSLPSTTFPIVMKCSVGNQGEGVYLAKNKSEYDATRALLLSKSEEYIEQEFIAESSGTDKRLFVVGDEVVAAMERRTQSDDDFRSNLHLGGSATQINPTVEERALAVRACQAFGLTYGGVDVIHSNRGPLILEVNPSPGFAISDVCKIDVALKVIEQYKKGAEV